MAEGYNLTSTNFTRTAPASLRINYKRVTVSLAHSQPHLPSPTAPPHLPLTLYDLITHLIVPQMHCPMPSALPHSIPRPGITVSNLRPDMQNLCVFCKTQFRIASSGIVPHSGKIPNGINLPFSGPPLNLICALFIALTCLHICLCTRL